jgi:hypothetical protein
VFDAEAPEQHVDEPVCHEVEQGQGHWLIVRDPDPRCSAHAAEVSEPHGRETSSVPLRPPSLASNDDSWLSRRAPTGTTARRWRRWPTRAFSRSRVRVSPSAAPIAAVTVRPAMTQPLVWLPRRSRPCRPTPSSRPTRPGWSGARPW